MNDPHTIDSPMLYAVEANAAQAKRHGATVMALPPAVALGLVARIRELERETQKHKDRITTILHLVPTPLLLEWNREDE